MAVKEASSISSKYKIFYKSKGINRLLIIEGPDIYTVNMTMMILNIYTIYYFSRKVHEMFYILNVAVCVCVCPKSCNLKWGEGVEILYANWEAAGLA